MSALMSALMRVCELIGFLLWLLFCCLLLGLAGGGVVMQPPKKTAKQKQEEALAQQGLCGCVCDEG